MEKVRHISTALVISLDTSSLRVRICHSCRVVHVEHDITLLTVTVFFLD
jgi:hypothetical protein